MKRAVVLALAALQLVQASDLSSTLDPTTVSSSATSTTSSASSTISPVFVYQEFSSTDVETCSSSFTISWSFIGAFPFKGFTLSVTNINVTQFAPPATPSTSGIVTDREIIPSVASGSVLSTGTVSAPPGSSTPLPGLIESLTTALDPSAQNSFTWNQVNLPQGWYQILATATDAGDTSGGVGGVFSTFNATSPPFFIRNGSDTSCLAVIGTSTSTGTTSPTSSSGASTSTGGQSSPTGGVGSLSSTTHVNRGAIAGGVVGGLAVIIAVIGVYLVYQQGRRKFSKDRDGLDNDPSNSPRPNIGKWGALGSFDSTKGSRSTPKDQVDPVTALNTAANSRTPKSSGFNLGDMGLAALGLAKSQDKNAPPSAFTAAKSKRSRRSSRRHSGTTESGGDIMGTSFNSSSFSGDGPYDPYANMGRGYTSMSTRETEEEFAYSPHEGKGVPMHNLSPMSSPTEEPYQAYQPSSSESLSSGAPGVGTIPNAYHSSPFITPPPSEPTSRHNSRSYSRTSLPHASSPTQTFGGFGHAESSSSSDFQSNRARAQSQHVSPTSSPRSIPRAPDIPEYAHHQKRASSPDALVYTLNREASQTGSSLSKNQAKRTPRKPVPSYVPQGVPDEISGQPSSPSSPMSPVYTFNGGSSSSTKPAKAGPTRRAAPAPPSESASSSSSSFHRANPHTSHLHSLEHKESAHSLASLRSMEGDLRGYSSVVGKEGAKQMHVLIPDMPLPQN